MEKTLFSTPELAEWLGVFHTTVRRWIEAGRIKGIRVGRNYKIPADEVIRILEGHGIPLPDVVGRYKSKYHKTARQQEAYGQGSILRRLLVVEDITAPAFVCRENAILGANRAFAELVGYSQTELIGLDVTEVVDKRDKAGIFNFARKRIQTPLGGPESYKARIKTSQNGGMEVEMTADALEGLKDVYLLVIKGYELR